MMDKKPMLIWSGATDDSTKIPCRIVRMQVGDRAGDPIWGYTFEKQTKSDAMGEPMWSPHSYDKLPDSFFGWVETCYLVHLRSIVDAPNDHSLP